MEEMIRYIFNKMTDDDHIMKAVHKTLRAQKRSIRNSRFVIAIMAGVLVNHELYIYEQSRKIEQLSNEIKELQGTKGE